MFAYGLMHISTMPVETEEGTGSLELKLQAVVGCLTWVLGSKLGSSARAAAESAPWSSTLLRLA